MPALELVNESVFVSADAFAEHVIGPALISQNDRDEDQCNNGHDGQCIL